MKFKFKIQQYQTEAVEQTVNVFAGQPSKDNAQYRRDLGRRKGKQVALDFSSESLDVGNGNALKTKVSSLMTNDTGWRNSDVELTGQQLLDNIHQQQVAGDIPLSPTLSQPVGLGACSLDIEMETGTGKTYVYIKTMFELNKRYGWSKSSW